LSEGVSVPTKPELVNKIDDINRLVKRPWTEQELVEKVRRQNALHAKFSGAERDHLTRQLELARARGDEEAVNRLQDKLDNLEVPRLAFRTSLTPQKKKSENKGPSQQEKLALLNAENRRRNAEAVRKAQLKERARAREIEMRLERGEQVDDDLSRRVRTRIKFMHDANDNDPAALKNKPQSKKGDATGNSGTSTPVNGNGSGAGTPKSGNAALLPHIAKLQELQRSQAKAGVPVIHKPLMDDDIIGALDLDIDVEID
jgi:RNA polymerase-associated protein RTF1